MTTSSLAHAYDQCLKTARGHYENFPVASRLLPAKLRLPIAVIYTFARTADDFADEGTATPEQRLNNLKAYADELHALQAGHPSEQPLFIALADVISRYQLPIDLFHDLLSAFSQDVIKHRYASFDEVIDYCRRSANPVGRLLLHLTNTATPQNLYRSDAICTALQLINFLQDITQDFIENNRIYLPQDEMSEFGITEQHLRDNVTDEAMSGLINLQIIRARSIMMTGAPLGKTLTGLFGFELRMIIQGGLEVLERLKDNLEINVYQRPRLKRRQGLKLAWQALVKR